MIQHDDQIAQLRHRVSDPDINSHSSRDGGSYDGAALDRTPFCGSAAPDHYRDRLSHAPGSRIQDG
jgi:hypothetical protein